MGQNYQNKLWPLKMLLRISTGIWTFGYSGFFFDMFLADLSNHAVPQTHSLVLFNLLTPCRDAKWWSTQFVFMHSALPDEAILHCVCVFVCLYSDDGQDEHIKSQLALPVYNWQRQNEMIQHYGVILVLSYQADIFIARLFTMF